MRLKPRDIAAIKNAAAIVYGDDVVVRLFGSRTDDTLRGGDIDLLIEVEDGLATERNVDAFRDRLFEMIDEQKVDVVYAPRSGQLSAFAALAARNAVALP